MFKQYCTEYFKIEQELDIELTFSEISNTRPQDYKGHFSVKNITKIKDDDYPKFLLGMGISEENTSKEIFIKVMDILFGNPAYYDIIPDDEVGHCLIVTCSADKLRKLKPPKVTEEMGL